MKKKISIKLKNHSSNLVNSKNLTMTSWTHQQFDELADILLNKTYLVANQKKFRLSEIEFYYCGEGHLDTYTHCSDEQQMTGKFYFHKYKTGTYKSGTYKGLDITLSPDNKTYFGVLIRSIQDQETGHVTEGPQQLKQKIYIGSHALFVTKKIIDQYFSKIDSQYCQ